MTIGVWGDSISYGQGDTEALGWVGRLRKSLTEAEVYNFGICGDTTEDLLKRFKTEAEAINPDAIIFAIGINDSKYSGDSDESLIPVEQYVTNLRQLISQAKTFTGNIAIIGATKVDETWRSTRGSRFLNEVIENYNKAMLELGREQKVLFIDVFESLDPVVDLDDGLHPNAEGYQKIVQIVRNEIQQILQ